MNVTPVNAPNIAEAPKKTHPDKDSTSCLFAELAINLLIFEKKIKNRIDIEIVVSRKYQNGAVLNSKSLRKVNWALFVFSPSL